jgi:hypothetical protein
MTSGKAHLIDGTQHISSGARIPCFFFVSWRSVGYCLLLLPPYKQHAVDELTNILNEAEIM